MEDVGYSVPVRKSEPVVLPVLRFEDLRAQGFVKTWPSLNKWVDEKGFPPGRMIGRNRVWTIAEVMAWVQKQPNEKQQPCGFVKQRAADSQGRAGQ